MEDQMIINMKKYIFLDIDGVLATPEYLNGGMWALNPKKLKLLRLILRETDASIVISSSWRKSTLEDTITHMYEEGFPFCDYIVGVTIRAYQHIDRSSKVHLSIPRGVEIKQWIDTNIHSNKGRNWNRKFIGKDFNYVILDDDSDMLLEQKDHFLKTSSKIGLTLEIANQAIKILNKTN